MCEGEKTEPNYFRSFRLSSARVEIVHDTSDPLNIVEATLAILEGQQFDYAWCVFDRDNHDLQRFNKALSLAHKNGIKVAYSNEAFELWYLLHFNFVQHGESRTRYKKLLTKALGKTYQKNSESMFDDLIALQRVAIVNASKLLKLYKKTNPASDNPSTTVHLLVTSLNSFL